MSPPDLATGFFGTPLLQWRSGSTLVTEHLYQPFQRIDRHQHDHPYICVVLSGRYRERSDAGERDCCTGSVLIHPPGTTHSDRFDGRSSLHLRGVKRAISRALGRGRARLLHRLGADSSSWNDAQRSL